MGEYDSDDLLASRRERVEPGWYVTHMGSASRTKAMTITWWKPFGHVRPALTMEWWSQTWPRKMRAWNHAPPERGYDGSEQFVRDYNRAVAKLLR